MSRSKTSAVTEFINDVRKDIFSFFGDREYCTGRDNTFLVADVPERLMTCASVQYLDRKIPYDLLKEQMTSFAYTSGPRFTKRIVLNRWLFGRPYFEEVPFDVNNHVSRVILPQGSTEDDLMDLMSELVSKPLDFRYSLWHVTYVDYNDITVLMWRMHHALADGQGFTRANINFLAALDPVSGQHTGKPVDASALQFKAGRAAKRRNSIAIAAETITVRVRNILQRLFALVLGLLLVVWSSFSLFFLATPITGRKSMLGATARKRQGFVEKQVAWSSNIKLSQVKEAKDILGCTVNDVLTSTLIGALERYLESRGQLKDPALSFLIPTSMRRPTDNKASNESSGFMISLPVGLGSALARVRSFNQRMSLVKKSFEPSLYYHGGGTLVLPWTIPSAFLEYGGFKVHGVISNVPGPTQPLAYGPAKIETMIPMGPPCGRNGLNMTILSYVDDIAVMILMDKDPSLDENSSEFFRPGEAKALAHTFEQEFQGLYAEAKKIQDKKLLELVGKMGKDKAIGRIQELTTN